MRPGKRILGEPLLHFAALGTLLFVAIQWSGFGDGTQKVIHVSALQQTKLRTQWRRETGRPPNEREFAALLQQHVDEEILFREAQRAGLAQSDIVVRDRLVKNLSFADGNSYTQPQTLSAYRRLLDTAAELGMAERDLVVRRRLVLRAKHAIESQVQVSESELRAWHASHSDDFRLPPGYQVEQVFFSKDANSAPAAERAALALKALRRGQPDDAVAGDRFLLDGALQWVTENELQQMLGDAVARVVAEAEPSQWTGPVASIYGLHLLNVKSAAPARTADFEDVRNQVVAAVYADKENKAVQAVLARLRDQYTVRVAAPLQSAAITHPPGKHVPAS